MGLLHLGVRALPASARFFAVFSPCVPLSSFLRRGMMGVLAGLHPVQTPQIADVSIRGLIQNPGFDG